MLKCDIKLRTLWMPSKDNRAAVIFSRRSFSGSENGHRIDGRRMHKGNQSGFTCGEYFKAHDGKLSVICTLFLVKVTGIVF